MLPHDHPTHDHGPARRPHHPDRPREARNLAWTAALSAGIMVAEVAGGLYSNSLALLSDAGHMLTDVSALGLSLVAIRFASRPADPRRTYGYYRLEILAALFNGSLLILLAGYIVYEAVDRFQRHAPVKTGVMLVVALIGLAANVVGLWLLSRSRMLPVRAAFLHVLSDALSSLAVVVAGVVIAFTGWFVLDPAASVAIAALIVLGAVRLVREAVDVLLEAVPAHLDVAEVLHAMERADGVCRIHDLHIWTLSSGLYALSAHVVVPLGEMGKNDEILTGLKTLLHDRFHVEHTTLQIESESFAHRAGEVH